jgi:nicotinamide-nucleotide amidase
MIVLPGVPREMETIFQETIAPMLKQASGGATFYEESLYVDIWESVLAPLIDATMHDNPGIYVKSHPKGEKSQPHIEIHFSTTEDNPKKAQENLQKAVAQLSGLITKSKGKIYPKRQPHTS